MQTNRLFARSINKSLLAIPLSLALTVCFSTSAFSQQVLKSNPVVTFGDVDSTMRITRDKLLANTKIKCNLPYCKVTGFSVSILPSGGQYRGPYKINGADTLNNAVIKILKNNTRIEARIFIDDISIMVNGSERKITSTMFTCVP